MLASLRCGRKATSQYQLSRVSSLLKARDSRSLGTIGVKAAEAEQMPADDHLGQDKLRVRKLLKQALKQTPLETLQLESRQIAQQVLDSKSFCASIRLGIYLHCPQLREVDTTLILQAALAKGKECKCFVPIVEDRNSNMTMVHLESMDGLETVPPFNILEPKALYNESQKPREDALLTTPPLDLLIMPGLGFDAAGRRLGRGGGYYDKFVAKCMSRAEHLKRPPPLLVACAFRNQMVDSVPTGDNDQDMDVIVTPDKVYKCSQRGKAEWM